MTAHRRSHAERHETPPASTQLAAEREGLLESIVHARRDALDVAARIARLEEDRAAFEARSERELAAGVRYANEDIARALLPVLDGLDHAVKAAAGDVPVFARVLDLRAQLEAVLAQHEIKSFATTGERFDPRFAEAVSLRQVEGVEPGIVVEEWRRGWTLHDRLLRAALVVVSGDP